MSVMTLVDGSPSFVVAQLKVKVMMRNMLIFSFFITFYFYIFFDLRKEKVKI
tara:strand:- start:259 stop:414 length:156 start_codon:yes stop_codon:yes gene_type:complete